MVEHFGPDVRRGRPVADHHVKRVSGELRHELIGMVLAARHLHRVWSLNDGPQQPIRNQLRHGIGHPHRERHRPPRRPALQRLLQLTTGGEDLLCVAIHDPAHFGKHERAALPFQQALAERALQHLHLGADRRL